MEPKNLSGVPRQPKAEEEEFEQKFDPEKFKKILKVDDSDSAQKRNKRNLNRSQEEGDDTEDVTPQATPSGEFKGLMGEQTSDEGIYGKQGVQSSQTGPSLKQVNPDFEVGDSSSDEADFDQNDQVSQQAAQYAPLASPPQPQNTLPTEEVSTPPEEPFSGEETLLTPPPSSTQTPTSEEKKPSKAIPSDKKTEVKLPHTLQPPSAPPSGKKTTAQEKPLPGKPSIKVPAKNQSEESTLPSFEEEAIEEIKPNAATSQESQLTTTNKPTEKTPASSPPAETQKPGPKAPLEEDIEAPLLPLSQMPIQVINREAQPHSKEKKEETTSVGGIPAADTIISPNLPQAPEAPSQVTPTTMTSFSQLSPQTFALFEKMVGLITVQTSMGVSTTTVTVSMPGSVFDKAEIVLQQFSTARNAFTVEIRTNPEALQVVNAEFNNLVAAMESAKLSVQINLQRPTLLNEYQATSRKGPRPVSPVKGKNKDKKDQEE